MSVLFDIVKDIGGEVHAAGTRALCPGPGHSKHDRSMSLTLGAGNRVIVNSFSSRTDWKECRDWLVDLGHLPRIAQVDGGPRSLRSSTSSAKRSYDPCKLAYAQNVWDRACPAGDTLVARYHRVRGLDPAMASSSEVRYLADCDTIPYGSKFGAPKTCPAQVLKITGPDDRFCGVHITFLHAPSGDRKRFVKNPKLILGRLMGAAVRLDPPSKTLLVAEGYENARSAARRFALPAWCLMSAKNFHEWVPPAGVEELLIAGDPGGEGRLAADALAQTCIARGIRPIIEIPSGILDWNALDTRCG